MRRVGLADSAPAGFPLLLRGVGMHVWTGRYRSKVLTCALLGSGSCMARQTEWGCSSLRQAQSSRTARPRPAQSVTPSHRRRLARAGEKKGGADTGPPPVDRAKTGSKHHVLTCGNGLPLASPSRAPTSTTTYSCRNCAIVSSPCVDDPADPATGFET